MTQIIGFAGRKQSGKNSLCNFFTLIHLVSSGISKYARLTDGGEIEVSDILGEKICNEDEWFSFYNPRVDVEGILDISKAVKTYALADPLKELCINILGLDKEKVYGTDSQKSELCDLMWKNMPDYKSLHSFPTGKMTVREVLQYMGTEVFRKIDNNVWINTLLRRIESEKYHMALISDVRFDNEIMALQNNGGIVVGLMRDVFDSDDSHASEQINFDLCDIVIDNTDMSLVEQGHAVYGLLEQVNCKNLPKRK